jgi:4-hydroxy-tetrahydrodipicolinate reductase
LKHTYGLIGSDGRLGAEVKSLFTENCWQLTLEVNKEFERLDSAPQVIIDCSLPEVFNKTMEFAEQYGSALVVATTGLSNENLEQLKLYAQKHPVVQSYNYSIGIQVLLKVIKEIKEITNGWDIEISETHHRFKKDRPSGTALMIKDELGLTDVNISSLRLGNVAGVHTVSFGGLGEVLSVTHEATSRRTFAEGIFKAAQFVINKKSGFYGFKEALFN